MGRFQSAMLQEKNLLWYNLDSNFRLYRVGRRSRRVALIVPIQYNKLRHFASPHASVSMGLCLPVYANVCECVCDSNNELMLPAQAALFLAEQQRRGRVKDYGRGLSEISEMDGDIFSNKFCLIGPARPPNEARILDKVIAADLRAERHAGPR